MHSLIQQRLSDSKTKSVLPFIEGFLISNNLPDEDIPLKIDYMFIGYVDENVVGIGGVEIYGKYGLLRSLVIKESYRGKGYGRALCKKLIEYAKLKAVREIYLLTDTAEKFFKKIGFEHIDRSNAPLDIRNTSEFTYLT